MGSMDTAGKRTLGLGLAAVALILALPAGARAQWAVDAGGGIAVPVADLADLEDPGPAAGAALSYRVHPRVAVRIGGGFDFLSGADLGDGESAPDMTVSHYAGGVELFLVSPDDGRFQASIHAGAGGSSFDTEVFRAPGEPSDEQDDFFETFFTAAGGIQLGAEVRENVSLLLRGEWQLVFSDEEKTVRLARLVGGSEGFDTLSVLPVTLGVRVRL